MKFISRKSETETVKKTCCESMWQTVVKMLQRGRTECLYYGGLSVIQKDI